MLKQIELFNGLSEDIDGIIITDPKILHYYIKLRSIEGVLLVTRKQSFLLVDFRYFEIAKQDAKNCDVVLFENFKYTFTNVLKEAYCQNIAISSSGLNVKMFFAYKGWFSDIKINLDDQLDKNIENQMAIKTQDEIEKISSAQKIAEKIFDQVLNIIKPGITEIDVSREINSLIFKNSEGTSFETIVVSGSRTSLPHGHATNKPILKGDLITFDFGVIFEGYCSDMTRTVCLGSVSDFEKEIYDIVLSGQEMAINKIKNGISCSEVDSLVRNYFKTFGYDKEFGHSLGHGVGLNIHELPNVSTRSLHKFENNMVVTVEPGLYFENKFGIRIEDMVVVKNEGVLNLTNYNKNLICL